MLNYMVPSTFWPHQLVHQVPRSSYTKKPKSRGTWAPHGVEGWYLGPAMDHYRSYHVYVPSTKATRIADKLAWLPSHVVMPTASSTDIAMAAAYDLTQALLHPSPASALSPLTDSQTNALRELAAIFGTVLSTPLTAQLDLLPTLPIHDEPRVPPAEKLPIDPRVPSIDRDDYRLQNQMGLPLNRGCH